MAWFRCIGGSSVVSENIAEKAYDIISDEHFNAYDAIEFMATLKNTTFTGVPSDVTDILIAWWTGNMVVVFLQNGDEWQYSNNTIEAQTAYMAKITTKDYTPHSVAVSYQKAFNNTGYGGGDHPIAHTYDLTQSGTLKYSANITLDDINYTT